MTEKEEKAIEYTKQILKYPKLLADTEKEGNFLREIDKGKIDTVVEALEQRIINQKIYAEEYEKVTKQLNCEVKDNLEKSIALEQKDKEIQELKEKWDKDTHTLQNQLDLANADRVEKDKMIKAMAKYLNSTDIDEDICKTVSKEFDCTLYQNEDFCINCIIGYFKEEVRKENE